MKKLILGCGYLGQRVAQAWLDNKHQVLAVTRSSERAAAMRESGIFPIVGDVTEGIDLGDCTDVDTLLFAVGFDRGSGKAIRDVYVDGLRRVIEGLPELPRRMIYISSTGVFGQNDGQFVDEQSPCEPTREGGKACLAAEELLRQHKIGSRTIILRLAGIYGPHRLPKLRDVVAGKPLSVTPNGYLNLIHVDDAAAVVLAAEQQLALPEMLLVSDGHPVLRQDFYEELAQQTNSPLPNFDQPTLDASSNSRAMTDKRIDCSRLRQLLEFTYRFPNYRNGLQDIVATEQYESL